MKFLRNILLSVGTQKYPRYHLSPHEQKAFSGALRIGVIVDLFSRKSKEMKKTYFFVNLRCPTLCGASAPLCSRWCLPSWSPTSSTTGPTRSMTGWRNCSSGPLVLTIVNYRGQRKQPGQFDHEEWWNIKRSANTLYCSHVKACLINSANWFTVAQVIGISIGNPFCLLWRSSRCLVVVWAE